MPSTRNMKETTPQHIIIKLLKTSDKEKSRESSQRIQVSQKVSGPSGDGLQRQLADVTSPRWHDIAQPGRHWSQCARRPGQAVSALMFYRAAHFWVIFLF